MKKALYVAGTFDEFKGKKSKIAEEVFKQIKEKEIDYHNGGNFSELKEIIKKIKEYNLIYWFAHISNTEEKLIKEIKQKNKKCVLITSKRNVEKKYRFQELLYHALAIKSNLFVEISKNDGRYFGRIIDPLGNVFLDYNSDFSQVGNALNKRAQELRRYTRVRSKQIGAVLEIANENKFFSLIKKYAEKMHTLIHAKPEAANRFFGNASFRQGKHICVTQRNIDKRKIGPDSFVGASLKNPVSYFGEKKPSIDTAIQIKLFNYYSNIKFILHTHAYVQDAPVTDEIVPCGALEEFDEIKKKIPDFDKNSFSINLKGHGSLVLVSDVSDLQNIKYTARQMPEVHPNEKNEN